MMTDADIKYFRRRLLAIKKRLVGDLSDLEEEALLGAGGEASGGLSDVPSSSLLELRPRRLL